MLNINEITVGEMMDAHEKYGITFEVEGEYVKVGIDEMDATLADTFTVEDIMILKERYGISTVISDGKVEGFMVDSDLDSED